MILSCTRPLRARGSRPRSRGLWARRALLLPAALASPWAVAAAPPGVRLVFDPAEDSSVTKTYTSQASLALDDLFLEVLDQEIGPETLGSPELAMDYQLQVRVTDRYLSVEDQRPLVLSRRFDAIRATQSLAFDSDQEDAEEVEVESKSALQGQSVRFTWKGEDAGYALEFEGPGDDPDQRDPNLLRGLHEDMSLRGLLPPEPVAVGDTWKPEPSELMLAFTPGGNLHLVSAEEAELDLEGDFWSLVGELEHEIDTVLNEQVEGRMEATYLGNLERDGRELARIELEADLDSDFEFHSMLERALAEFSEMEDIGLELDIEQADLSLDFEAEGELLWDLELDQVSTLQIDGDLSFTMRFAIAGAMDGSEGDFVVELEMSGESSCRVE